VGRSYASEDPRLDEAYIAKLGSSYDRRKRPQIRFRKGRHGLYLIIRGPFPHRDQAFREARRYRNRNMLKLAGHASLFVLKGAWGRTRGGRRGQWWIAIRTGWGRGEKRPIVARGCTWGGAVVRARGA
jgi:hypothetical protein